MPRKRNNTTEIMKPREVEQTPEDEVNVLTTLEQEKKVLEDRINDLKASLKAHMEQTGTDKIVGATHQIVRVKSAGDTAAFTKASFSEMYGPAWVKEQEAELLTAGFTNKPKDYVKLEKKRDPKKAKEDPEGDALKNEVGEFFSK